jgi:hypothetical protein
MIHITFKTENEISVDIVAEAAEVQAHVTEALVAVERLSNPSPEAAVYASAPVQAEPETVVEKPKKAKKSTAKAVAYEPTDSDTEGVAETAVEEAPVEPAAEPAPVEVAPVVTPAQAADAVREYGAKAGIPAARQLLESCGVKKTSEITEDNAGAVYAAFKGASNAL